MPAVLGPHHPFVSPEARDRFLADYDRLAAEWPLAWETSTIDTALGSTHVRSCGPVEGEPLVLLPGAGGDSVQWPMSMIEALSDKYRVHAVDNIEDFGRSVSSRPIRSTSDRMSWFDQLLDVLSPASPVVLIGGSRGAWLSAEYALHSPHRLTATVWMSPALVVSGWSLGAVRFLSVSMRAMRRPTTENVRAMLSWILPGYAARYPAEFERFLVEHTAVGFQCFDLNVVGRGWGPRRFSSSELRSIRVPVLYLAGAEERLGSSRAGAARLKKVAPQIRTAILAEAGHDMIWVRTDDVSRRILDFLGQTERLGE